MADFNAIATALAARFDAAQLTAPTGYQTIRLSTADIPNQMPPLPCVLVFLDEGSFDSANSTRIGVHNFTVRFYYNQSGDLARDNVALRKWLTVLADQLKTGAQLSGNCVLARITGWRLGAADFAGESYSSLELTVAVTTSEGWTVTA